MIHVETPYLNNALMMLPYVSHGQDQVLLSGEEVRQLEENVMCNDAQTHDYVAVIGPAVQMLERVFAEQLCGINLVLVPRMNPVDEYYSGPYMRIAGAIRIFLTVPIRSRRGKRKKSGKIDSIPLTDGSTSSDWSVYMAPPRTRHPSLYRGPYVHRNPAPSLEVYLDALYHVVHEAILDYKK